MNCKFIGVEQGKQKKMKASSGSYTPVILLCDEENSEK